LGTGNADDARVLRAGMWPRFDSYEITDGVVHPTEGARLELYDPWEEYVAVWQRRQRLPRKKGDPAGPKRNNPRAMPPYQELLWLAARLQAHDSESGVPVIGKVDLTPDLRKRVLAWCRHNGLLGLLHHETLEIWLAPIWERAEGSSLLSAVAHGWQRSGGGWVHASRNYAYVNELDTTLCGAPVSPARYEELRASPATESKRGSLWSLPKLAHVPPSMAEKIGPIGGVVIRRLGVSGLEVAPLGHLRRYFFQIEPESHKPKWPMPNPRDEGFWRSYAEPVHSVVQAAEQLSWIMKALATHSTEYVQPTPQQHEQLTRAQDHLAAYTENTWPRVVLNEEGKPQVRWSAPSLLGSFALMIMFDLAGKGTIRTCAHCGTPFASSARQAVYCSDRCRNAVQQRTFRARHAKGGLN
jgi:hypothetical protein